jgi:hypothetical protein
MDDYISIKWLVIDSEILSNNIKMSLLKAKVQGLWKLFFKSTTLLIALNNTILKTEFLYDRFIDSKQTLQLDCCQLFIPKTIICNPLCCPKKKIIIIIK